MSDEAGKTEDSEKKSMDEAASKLVAKPAAAKSDGSHDGILLVPYPKIVFLYPTFLVALISAIILSIAGRFDVNADDALALSMTWIFLITFGVNLMVIAFDFPRATSLTMLFLFAAIGLGGILVSILQPDLIPSLGRMLRSIHPVANATFFNVLVVMFTALYIAVMVSVRFDYWEVRHNELLHHHGMLSDLKRFSSPNLRIDKEVNDVFEYLLLRSGRLILQPSGERRAVILDNVLFINKKEAAITKMLGTLQVEVRPDSDA